jgi:hypothetical protein
MHHLFKKNYSDQIVLLEKKHPSYAPLTPSPIIIIYINKYKKEIIISDHTFTKNETFNTALKIERIKFFIARKKEL